MDVELHHKDGIEWYKAPIPPRFHRCRRQTWGWAGFNYIERCACGAIKFEGHWMERNSSRKAKS